MAKKWFMVKNYKISLGFESSGGGGGPKSRGYLACLGDNEHCFVVYFSAPGNEMAPPCCSSDATFGSIDVPVDEMQHYVDLVRNEKPVYVYLNSDKPQWNSISTSKEPVGEEES